MTTLTEYAPEGALAVLSRLMAEGMSPVPAQARQLELPLEPMASPAPKPTRTSRRDPRLLEKLDQWFWRQRQREREAYLAQAHDLFDLEARMRALDRGLDPRLL